MSTSIVKALGIETSCDETAVAIVTNEKKILSNLVLTQLEQHKIFGGVVPEIAARSHLEVLDSIMTEALKEANLTLNDLELIAVTAGPGLIGGVLVGAMFGKGLALASGKPVIAVNHLEGHALTVRLTNDIEFPYLLLLVSGGHCQILEVKGVSNYKVIGQTMDDAAGEAFDKVARMLNLDYPGGPNVEQRAKHGDSNKFNFPKPMLRQSKYDFSFSGLKTAVKRLIDEQRKQVFDEQFINDVCASFQRTVADILVNRLINAVMYYGSKFHDNPNLVIAGGVAANQYIKQRITEALSEYNFNVLSPSPKLCVDNAAMIAWAGLERFALGLVDDLSFTPRSRWPLEELK